MQIEILFRSWNSFFDEFFYFKNGRYFEDFECKKESNNNSRFSWSNAEQYIGLTDKNGVKIFEGDKVNVFNKPYNVKSSIVVWGVKSHGWSLKCEVIKENKHHPSLKYYGLGNSKNIEVIGNIHDNEK